MFNDLRHALRQLLKQPGFTAVAVLTLAIGIGATTAVYTVVQAVILDPIPSVKGDRLVAIQEFNRERQAATGLSATLLNELRARRDIFDRLCAARIVNARLAIDGFSTALRGFAVSSGFFELLEAAPALGRLPFQADEASSTGPVMVISDGWWQRQFGGDPNVIGRTVQLETGPEPYTIIGVMPPAFQFPDRDELGQFWIPATVEDSGRGPSSPRVYRNWQAMARLAPGVEIETAQAALATYAQALAVEHPGSNEHWTIRIQPLHSLFSTEELRRIYLGLLAAVVAVLLIGGVNVANLMLARAELRRQEFAVRLALGATRLHFVRQILAESLLLSLAAGGLGLLLARWGIDALQTFLQPSTPLLRVLGMDHGVYLGALALATVTGLLSGLPPAWQATRSQVNEALKSAGKGIRVMPRRWLAQSLVVAEISLAMVVLSGAGLMLASVGRILAIDPGFDSRNLVQVGLGTPVAGDHVNAGKFFRDAASRFQSLLQVEAVGWITPMTGGEYVTEESRESVFLTSRQCSTGAFDYFKAIRAPLLAGRMFDEEDLDPGSRNVLVNQSLARELWPGQSAIGKRFQDVSEELASGWYEVVGVVGDIRDHGFEHPPGPTYYEPESREAVSFAFVMVRSGAPLESLAPTLRAALTGLATGIPTPTFHSMKERLWKSSAARRTCLQLFGLFAVVGVMMTVVGIYGITAFSTAARTQELGIRMALGATRWKVVGLVLRQGLRLVVIGIGLGLLAAHSLTRFLGSLLYDVSPTDPGVLLGISVLFALVALTGCYLPARKVSKINPMEALRYE